MTLPYDQQAAVVVLPAVGSSRLQDAGLRTWLSRATLTRTEQPRELLAIVLEALNLPYPDAGLAALRMWGQTGDRPTAWIAAADPVYLEPRLDHLCLHAFAEEGLPAADHRAVFDHLQKMLAVDERVGFARIGIHGYIRSEERIATASLPAYVIDGQLPNEFMPAGEEAAAYRGLRSEMEMALHDMDLNARRLSAGLWPINSLWLWGGGYAPETVTEPLPPLFAGEALLRGYWLSKTAVAEPWPGSVAACLEASVTGFVAIPAIEPDDIDDLEQCLSDLRAALHSGRLGRLQLFFADGLTAIARPADRWRFWRRTSPLLGQA